VSATALYTDAAEFPLPEDLAERAKSRSVSVSVVEGHDRDEIAEAGADCEGLFTLRATVDEALLECLPRLRVIARIGTGYERIDVDAAARRGICVTFVPEHCTEEMADHVMLGVLAFSKQLPLLFDASRAGTWLTISEVPWPRRLSTQTLGLVGFGRSARRTAEKANAFGIRSFAWNRTPRPAEMEELGVTPASFEEVLGCDFVSLHIPGTPDLRHLVDARALEFMKPTAVLINTARGSLVDTDGLVEALASRRLGGAFLDVISPEPLPRDHPLWTEPNAIVTSHTASLSVEAIYQATSTAFDDLTAVLSGELPTHPVPELAAAWL
jgi:phosphoglycerate dehydrogenase-like enzyme